MCINVNCAININIAPLTWICPLLFQLLSWELPEITTPALTLTLTHSRRLVTAVSLLFSICQRGPWSSSSPLQPPSASHPLNSHTTTSSAFNWPVTQQILNGDIYLPSTWVSKSRRWASCRQGLSLMLHILAILIPKEHWFQAWPYVQ